MNEASAFAAGQASRARRRTRSIHASTNPASTAAIHAAILEAKRGFRRIKGYRHMHHLVAALQRHEESMGVHSDEEAA